MPDPIEFGRDDHGRIVARAANDHVAALAAQLTSDIADYAPDCLELLHLLAEVRGGRSPVEEFTGNSAVFRATADGVTVWSLGPVPRSTAYSFEEARAVVLRYFDFLAPSRARKENAVARWESEFGRQYPGRAELGIR